MSYEHRCLMRRRLELYHDLLTEQLRPRIEAAAAATTDNPDSDTDQYIDDDTDNTDDTDDSDEDLCEWEHAENKSSEESYARVTQWRCGLERTGTLEEDAPDYGENTEKVSDQVELEQQDDNEAPITTEVRHIEHVGSGSAADTNAQTSGEPPTPLSVALPSNSMTKTEEKGRADAGGNTSRGPESNKREEYDTAFLNQLASGSDPSKDDSPDKLTTPPSSPCHESSVTVGLVSMNERNYPTSLRQPSLINHSQTIPTHASVSSSPRRSKSLPPLNLLPSHCPPTPPPDTSSSASTYSQLRFTVTPAELKFFYKHIEQVEYMIRGIDYQFQMQEYRNEVRRQNRRRRRRAEVEERLRWIEWSNEMPSEDWSNVAGMGERGLVEESMEETEHQSWETATGTGEWDSGGLEGDESAGTKGEDDDNPNSYGQCELGETCGTDGYEENGDSVWADGAGDENAVTAEEDGSSEKEWDSAWSSTSLELEEKTQLHQPIKRSSLRKGYTPDDMVWEEAVAEAEYLSFYGHQFKKDERGRRYWRL